MTLVRFVHTADLHLDRQFRGLRRTPERVAEAVRDATLDTFQNIIDFTTEQEADALLIAGDVYDGAARSLRAQLRLVKGLEWLDAAGIRAFLCHGSADPLDDWTSRLRFPSHVHRFGAAIEAAPVVPDGAVEVVGVSAPRVTRSHDLPRAIAGAGRAPFTIGMFHGEVSPWLERLPELAVDYWALGGRRRPELVRARDPAVVYPGAPQSVRAREAGPGGVYLVEIGARDDRTIRFEALDVIRWASIEIDAVEGEGETALIDRLTGAVAARLAAAERRPVIYRLVVRGDAPSTAGAIAAQLNELYADGDVFAWCYDVAFRPGRLPDRDRRMQADDLVAHLLRLSDESQLDPALRQRLWDELAVLLDDDRFTGYRSGAGLTDAHLPALIGAAEEAALAALGTHA